MAYPIFVKRPEYLNEWDFFVWRHRHPGNLVMHFFSLTLFLVAVPMFFISWNFWWVLAAVISAPIGTAGHYFFKDGGVRVRDFTAPRTVYSLIIIYGLIALGRYGVEVARVKKIVDEHEGSNS